MSSKDLIEVHHLDEDMNNQLEVNDQMSPPEPLDEIKFCAEKCRYVPEMCTKPYNLSWPAPTCLNHSLTVKDDMYWPIANNEMYVKRNNETVKLVSWVASRARERRQAVLGSSGYPCEEVPSENNQPMMFPEEFEFITKLMANRKPKTYLEWGCGTSTSFYPLLASGKVVAIDGFPPWCKQVGEEPRVKCMSEKEKRLFFYCPEILGADGTKLELRQLGKIPAATKDKDVESAMDIYVNSLSRSFNGTGVSMFDVALVDGRFRVQCAIKLLPYLHDDSILLMHDFFVRIRTYGTVLEYYDVIGYARSVVALRKKRGLESEEEIYKQYMNRASLTRNDIGN